MASKHRRKKNTKKTSKDETAATKQHYFTVYIAPLQQALHMRCSYTQTTTPHQVRLDGSGTAGNTVPGTSPLVPTKGHTGTGTHSGWRSGQHRASSGDCPRFKFNYVISDYHFFTIILISVENYFL